MRRGAATGVALLLASCGSSAVAPVQSPQPIRPAPPPTIALAPPPISIPPPPTRDQCGAWELQHLVGRPRTDIPVAVDLSHRRVLCTTCPRTMDYSPQRLTIEYDAETNRVTRVACG